MTIYERFIGFSSLFSLSGVHYLYIAAQTHYGLRSVCRQATCVSYAFLSLPWIPHTSRLNRSKRSSIFIMQTSKLSLRMEVPTPSLPSSSIHVTHLLQELVEWQSSSRWLALWMPSTAYHLPHTLIHSHSTTCPQTPQTYFKLCATADLKIGKPSPRPVPRKARKFIPPIGEGSHPNSCCSWLTRDPYPHTD